MDENIRFISEVNWDFIIIGTGIGGSVLGLSLARAGKKVLFCEKGLSLDKINLTGDFTENLNQKKLSQKEIYQKSGRRFNSICDLSYKKPREFRPFLGEGAGGSSLLYGMAMERAKESDFDEWPIPYNEMKPFYEEAEVLFNVSPSPNLTSQNIKLEKALIEKGLHPYRLPLASNHFIQCNGCQGHICNHYNKNHAGNCALQNALKYKNVFLLDQCEVQSLIQQNNKISEIVVLRNGQKIKLKSQNFVLAAGALETPRILFNSNQSNSNGLANSSGLVGKYLMRHLIDLYVLESDVETNENNKQLAFNDFYCLPEGKGGTVQSFGKLPPLEIILKDIYRDLSYHSYILKFGAQFFSPVLKFILKKKLSNSIVFASIVEDSPFENNRVLNIPFQTSFTYKVQNQDKLKLIRLRKKLIDVFGTKLKLKIYGSEKNTLIAHACGTCRMGLNPKTSVVDINGKTHDIENLYISDASLFPTSLGVNPALTIAANALRIGKNIIEKQNEYKLISAYKSMPICL